jgi:hypothetical protein
MNICGTSSAHSADPAPGIGAGPPRSALAAALLVSALVSLLAAPALADDDEDDEDGGLEARAEATLGTRLYIIDSPYDNDFLGGYWDQYRHTRKKNNDPPFFIDLFHSDVGLARDDDTYLVRLESWSPNYSNDRVEVDADYKGLGFDLDYRRYRSEELRFFPKGTFQDQVAPFPAFGTQYTPDATEQELRNQNERFWLRRTGVDGELRFRPEGFGFEVPVLTQASLRGGFEQRKGWRQDSFLLNSIETAPDNRRFRGNRRRVDQEVSSVGAGVVLSPGGDWVTDFDVFFESFREKADVVTFDDIAAGDPTIPPPIGNTGSRAFNFTPNTDRISGSVRVAGKLGPVSLHGGGFFTYLRQTNKAPLQRALGQDKQELTTWSGHTGFEVPLGDRADLSGFVKLAERHNGLDENDLEPGRFIAPILRRRSEVEAQVELAARPQAGSLVATGYRLDYVDRNFRYPSPIGIDPPLSLVEGNSLRHTVYLRARARLLRQVQIRGELGWEYAPQRDFPRDATYTVYFDGQGSYTLPRPIPITLSLYGGVRDGHGNGIVLTGAGSQARKDLDRLQWNYGATLAAIPTSKTTITLSFIENRDEQDFPYLRTDFPRVLGSGSVTLLPDSERPHYRSDVKSLSLGGSQKLTDSLDARAFTNVNWVRAWFTDSSQTSVALETTNEIKSKILSVGGGLGWQAMSGLRFDVGYRFDQYVDRRDDEPIQQDDERHTFTLAATVDLGLFSGAIRGSRVGD